jgi:hypothetical protein
MIERGLSERTNGMRGMLERFRGATWACCCVSRLFAANFSKSMLVRLAAAFRRPGRCSGLLRKHGATLLFSFDGTAVIGGIDGNVQFDVQMGQYRPLAE